MTITATIEFLGGPLDGVTRTLYGRDGQTSTDELPLRLDTLVAVTVGGKAEVEQYTYLRHLTPREDGVWIYHVQSLTQVGE